jgi:hypothetical protein
VHSIQRQLQWAAASTLWDGFLLHLAAVIEGRIPQTSLDVTLSMKYILKYCVYFDLEYNFV